MAIYHKEQAAAELIGVRPRTLQRWRADGTGPAFTRIGPRFVAYRAEDLDSWAASRVFQSRAAELAQQGATSSSRDALVTTIQHNPHAI